MKISKLTALAVLPMALGTHAALAEGTVSNANDFASFTDSFCAADRTMEHVFVVPLSALEDNGTLNCDFGNSTIRVSEPDSDPGHYIMNIDPPTGVADGLDCDGKADKGMSQVAINCLPANMEGAGHKKG